MPGLRDVPARRDMRLPGWDYRRPGPYAITICTEHRIWRFGDVIDGRQRFNDAGTMAISVWCDMAVEFPTVTLDAFVLMPNHLHAIVWLAADDIARNPQLGDIVQRFKALTTARYARGVHKDGWDPFDRRLWQRNYYDHIVRDAADLDHCRRYISANPANWHEDRDYEPDPTPFPRIPPVRNPAP